MAVQLTRRRFTVDEYYRMAEAGILGEDDRVELIDGEIVEMVPIGDRHAGCVDYLTNVLARLLGEEAQVRVQNPLRLSRYSEPQPDVMLLRPRPDFYRSGHPTPGEVLLLIEVADTSVDLDRRVKVPLYARHGIPELWVVDLAEGTVTVYRDPAPDGYRVAQVLRRGEQLQPAAFADLAVPVADIIG
ncbi:MAG: Uma2 family endonuclease [Chloroflexi bacterium]|nr:Uma2 family endonuclease [Chloroflexota bacterium]